MYVKQRKAYSSPESSSNISKNCLTSSESTRALGSLPSLNAFTILLNRLGVTIPLSVPIFGEHKGNSTDLSDSVPAIVNSRKSSCDTNAGIGNCVCVSESFCEIGGGDAGRDVYSGVGAVDKGVCDKELETELDGGGASGERTNSNPNRVESLSTSV